MEGNNPVERPTRWIILPVFVLFMMLGFVLGDAVFFYREGPNSADRPVYIPKGSTLRDVTDILSADKFVDTGRRNARYRRRNNYRNGSGFL